MLAESGERRSCENLSGTKKGWVSRVAEVLPFFFCVRVCALRASRELDQETGVSFDVATRNCFVNYSGAIL